MATFTIESENNMTAHSGLPAGADESQSFSNEKELAKLTAEWPVSRLLDVRRNGEDPVEEVAAPSDAARAGANRRNRIAHKKAEVIALMKRAKGASLPEIIEATGWQKHTVRGFVSILGAKGGEKIESSKNAAGERCYRIAK